VLISGEGGERDCGTTDRRPDRPDLGFVICIEAGILEPQAVLLCASIRRYGGRFAPCPIYAVSPRPGHRPADASRKLLADLGVHYIEEDLNVKFPTLPMISNKPLTAAHIEASTGHEQLVVLDTDTLVLAEPGELELGSHEDVAARPADARGVSTTDLEGDRFIDYWRRLCAAVDVSYDSIPMGWTSVDHVRVKAYYQTGCVCVRRERGIFGAWGRSVAISIEEGIGPELDGKPRRGSVGYLTGDAAKWWGADITALTLAIWGATERVRLLGAGYNYPLHMHERIEPNVRPVSATGVKLVHYHWMFDTEHIDENPLLRPAFGLPSETLSWLRGHLPLDVAAAHGKRLQQAAPSHGMASCRFC
jgi:hypothetical protein